MRESYCGFVYFWLDTKAKYGEKRRYIGSHMGSVNDGYVGSGKKFIKAYEKRPDDFKRRILEFVYVYDDKALKKREQFWFDKRKDCVWGYEYYNISIIAGGGNIVNNSGREMTWANKLRQNTKGFSFSANRNRKISDSRAKVTWKLIDANTDRVVAIFKKMNRWCNEHPELGLDYRTLYKTAHSKNNPNYRRQHKGYRAEKII